MKASPTVASAPSQRDTLSALLHDVITSPNQGAHALAKSCPTTALAFAELDQSDARLAARHSALREKALVTALAQALKVVEQYDLSAADQHDQAPAGQRPAADAADLRVERDPLIERECTHYGARMSTRDLPE